LDCGQDYYKPRFGKGDVIEFVKGVNARNGVTTINLAIEQNGNIMPKTLAIMKKVKAAIRKGGNEPTPNPPTPTPPTPTPPTDDDAGDDDSTPNPCKDGKKKFKANGKKRTCAWLKKKEDKQPGKFKKLCGKKAKHCEKTCGLCDDGDDGDDDGDGDDGNVYKIYSGRGYCSSGNDKDISGKFTDGAACWKKCKNKYKYFYAELSDDGDCYCQDECTCMEQDGGSGTLAIVPIAFALPSKC